MKIFDCGDRGGRGFDCCPSVEFIEVQRAIGLPEKLAYCLFGVRIEYRKGSLYEQDAAEAVAAESCPMNLVKAVCLKPSKFVNPHPVQCSLLLILINVLQSVMTGHTELQTPGLSARS